MKLREGGRLEAAGFLAVSIPASKLEAWVKDGGINDAMSAMRGHAAAGNSVGES